MASEALRLHLDGLEEDRVEIPSASDLDAVEKMLCGQRGHDFSALVEVAAEPAEQRIVRVNITIEERLLRDARAQQTGTKNCIFAARLTPTRQICTPICNVSRNDSIRFLKQRGMRCKNSAQVNSVLFTT